jgi:hypothetical protein
MILFLILSFSFSDFIDDINDLLGGINKVSGPTAFEVLQFDLDAKAGGMAGNYWDLGAHAILFNPAEIIGNKENNEWNKEAIFTHRELPCGMNTEFLGYTMPFFGGGIGMTLIGFFSGEMELYGNIPGDPVGSYSAENLIAGIAYARKFSDLSIGISTKFLNERIFTDNYSTYSFDIGFSKLFSLNRLGAYRVDFVLLHLGPKISEENFRLPTTWHLGLKTNVGFFKGGISLNKPLNTVLQYSIGGEYSIGWLKIRAGKKFRNPLESFSVGFGFTKNRFSIDYSYSPNKNKYGDSHLFTASVGL